MRAANRSVIPDSHGVARDPGSRIKKLDWIPAFAGMTVEQND